jgi:cytochrome c554/c'-like protein
MSGSCKVVFCVLLTIACGAQTVRPKVPCAACHAQGRSQPATSMARAAETPEESAILASNPLLTFKSGAYSYKIERRGDQSIYGVTDGKQTFEVPIGWAVGAGRVGQTYVYQKDGEFYESRVSYFSATKTLDITIGHQGNKPSDLFTAAGRRIGPVEAAKCFECHATNATQAGKLTLDKMQAGVRCVHCHTAANKHLAGLAEGELHLDEMKKLSTMPAEDVLTFCGQCHRTAADVNTNANDLNTVRFAPYRLSLSKCYDLEDKRITCLACHDPHEEVTDDQAHYDSKCLACHGGGKVAAHPCKVAKKDCATCHMPKVELPGSHHQFVDHLIQIAKKAK